MKQAVLWLIPALALTSVGSLTYATSRPTDGDGDKKKDTKVSTKTVHFAHDKDIDTYLTSIKSYMEVPPRDGRFGASRVPTFHGRNFTSVPGYKDINEILKEESVMSYVVGVMPETQIQSYRDYKAKNPTADVVVPAYRLTPVHFLDRQVEADPVTAKQDDGKANASAKAAFKVRTKARNALYLDVMKDIETIKAKVDAEGYETYSQALNVNGVSGHIMMKAVRAVDKTCYTCHSTIKEGQPIGHVVAVIWNKGPK